MSRPTAVPQTGGSGRAIVLAVVMHLLLGALLFFGIRWQSSAPAVIQAELWSATPQTAAPAPRPAVVQVAPPPRVEAPTPPVVRPTPEPPQPKADIVERAPAKVEPPKKKEVPKVEVVKPVAKAQPAPPPLKAPPKPNPELLKLQQQAAIEAPARPPSELAALLSSASKESTGKDQQTSGPRGDQSGYTARLRAAIRSQMRYPGTAAGNPYVSIRIEQLPNGEVLNVTVLKGSGVQAFDDAVERAVRAASPLPRPTQGPAPRELEVRYNMYDKS